MNKFSITKRGLYGHHSQCNGCKAARYLERLMRDDRLRERKRAYNQKYDRTHPYRRAIKKAQSRMPHRRKTVRERERRRRREDPQFRLTGLLRQRIYKALRGVATKSAATLKLLGCSVDELREHLEKQFQPGMTWADRGAWHVDHIRPVSSFDLTDPEQQQQCFHYTNLQPLWAADNIRKGARYQPGRQMLLDSWGLKSSFANENA